ANSSTLGLIGAWLAVLGYTFQIYFDFSAYSDMAVGIGHLFGIKLPANFNAPYTARSITDFWGRWHITLSTWFREYLFLPLSRALLKRTDGKLVALTRSGSLLLTMALIGLWHGLTGTFLLWGIYHGVLLALHAQFRRPGEGGRWRQMASRLLTLGLVMVGWVLFRSPSVQTALGVYAALLGLHGTGLENLQLLPSIGLVEVSLILVALFVVTGLPLDTDSLRPRAHWTFA